MVTRNRITEISGRSSSLLEKNDIHQGDPETLWHAFAVQTWWWEGAKFFQTERLLEFEMAPVPDPVRQTYLMIRNENRLTVH
jgi:hypothetical protein